MLTRWISTPTLVLALGLGLGLGAPALAEEAHDLEALVIELANTPEQHKAVAAHYRAEAAQARTDAARHRSMGASYGGGKFVMRQQMQKHCEELAAGFEAQAKQYEELAKLHDQAAGAK